jgi:hypothetical protein
MGMFMSDNEETMGTHPEELGEISGMGEAVEPAQTQNPVEPGLDLPDDAVNLVPYLLEQGAADPKVKDYLEKTLPKQIVDHFNEDWDARAPWMEKRKDRIALYLGDLKEKKEPFKNCANMHVPILSSRILRLASRVWTEIFKQGQPIFSVHVSSSVDQERADFVTKHQNWQFRSEIPEFPRHVFRFLIDFFRDGDGVFDSYRDLEKNVNRHEYLSPEEFVYPYTRKSAAVDMSDVPRKTKVLFPYKRDLEKMQKLGFYAQVDKVVKEEGSHDTEHEQVTKDAVDKYEGKDRQEHLSDAPYYLFEYHGWSKLPYQEEEIPIRAVLHPKTMTLLGLYSRYYDDPEDSARFQKQSIEHDQYLQAIGQYQQAMQKEKEVLARIQEPDVPQDESLAIAQQVQQYRPSAPISPQWMQHDEQGLPKPPEPCKQKIIERFSHGVCIENPDGSHGLGIGMLLMPHQKAAQICLNQFIDQGTLANGDRGVWHENLKLDPGVHNVDPGTFERVHGVPPDQLEKAIVQFKSSPANTQLLQGVQMQMADADAISSAPDVLSGQKEGDETFRGQATRLEQATKQLTLHASNVLMCLDQVAKNNALLNFMYEPEQHLLDVLDPATQKMTPIKVGRELYRGGFSIIFSADLSFTSRAARIAEADDALGMVTKGIPPQLASMILKPQMFAALAINCLKARGLNELVALVNTEQEIETKMQSSPTMPTPGGPPGVPPGQPPQMPHPAVPTGQPTATPGTVKPQSRIPVATPTEAAPSK